MVKSWISGSSWSVDESSSDSSGAGGGEDLLGAFWDSSKASSRVPSESVRRKTLRMRANLDNGPCGSGRSMVTPPSKESVVDAAGNCDVDAVGVLSAALWLNASMSGHLLPSFTFRALLIHAS